MMDRRLRGLASAAYRTAASRARRATLGLGPRFRRWAGRLWAEHPGLVVGMFLGALAGWFGALAGALIGFMIDGLVRQGRADRAAAGYLENPGPGAFRECEGGAAAACALLLLVLTADRPGARRGEEALLSRVVRTVAEGFRLGPEALPELESYARAAASRLNRLNPDLLSESFRARRRGSGVPEAFVAALQEVPEGPRSAEIAERILSVIAPERGKRRKADDPYAVLGVTPATPLEEVKSVFRRLAVQFHPDGAVGLGGERERSAAEAFMKIERAYREVLRRSAEHG